MLTKEQFKEIAKTYGRGKTGSQLAKEFGVSRQRINEIVNRMKKRGIMFPALRQRTYVSFNDVIIELKQEKPEIFR